MATGSNIRVGDAEREAVASQLREHYADGRLTLDELNERLDQAFAAKTRAELLMVTRDLPAGARPLAGAGAGAQGALPGGTNAWQDATSSGAGYPGSSGSSGRSGYTGGGSPRRSFAVLAPFMALFWLFVVLGSLFAFGIGGGRPLAVVFFLAALAFLRRLLGGRGRGRGRGGRRCGHRR
jgi:hypothetical protein